MKVTIAYTKQEEKAAEEVLALVCGKLPQLRVKKSDLHAPFLHIYISYKGKS